MTIKNHFVDNSAYSLTYKLDELVINWHITETCNYKCTYCFAKWGKPKELHRSLQAIEKLLDNLATYFIKCHSPLNQKLSYQHVRINFAGGEPMILGSTLSIILLLAKQKGFRTSIITNGHYLVNTKFDIPNDVLDMVGISFDSQSYDNRCGIGRVDRKGNSLSSEDLKLGLARLSSTQKNIKTKINTVVNKLNWQEDFSKLIYEIQPDKWKVFQVMPYGTDELIISPNQFKAFIDRHQNKSLPISPESNIEMTESYLMIDPSGRFYQNSAQKSGYTYSDIIGEVSVEEALKQIKFNEGSFTSRYLPSESEVLFHKGVCYE